MNSQSQAKSPERLRAMVAGTLANFQHPTLKHNLTALKALHHVAWLDDTIHIELQMPFVWSSAFEALKEQCSAELLRITGAKAIDWKLTHSIATLKRVKNQPGINGVKNIIAISSGKGGVASPSATIRPGARFMRCWSWRRDAPRGSISKLPRWCVSWDCSTGIPRMSCRCAYSPQPSCRMAATHCIAALLMCLTNSACRLCRRTL